MDTQQHSPATPDVPDPAWDILLTEVRAMLRFHHILDGDDRLAFASTLRLLASREERAGIYERRYGPTMIDLPEATLH